MYCRKCGAKLKDSAKFCDNCGAEVIIVKQKTYEEKYKENKEKSKNLSKKDRERMEKHKDEKNPYIKAGLFAAVISLVLAFFPWGYIDKNIGLSLPMRIAVVVFALLGDYHSTKAKQVNNLLYGKYGFRIQPELVKLVSGLSIFATIMGLFDLFNV